MTMISKYASFMRINFKSDIYYIYSYLLSILAYAAYPILMLIVWSSIFSGTTATSIAGYSPIALYAYFFVAYAGASMQSGVSEAISSDIESGSITSELILPISYAIRQFIDSLPSAFTNFSFVFLPIVVLTAVFAGISMSWFTIAAFALEIFLLFSISFLIEFIIGVSSIYLVSTGGISSIITLLTFLSGGVLPNTFFPQQLQTVLQLLPFNAYYYNPAATFTGALAGTALLNALVVESAWALALFVFATVYWKMSRGKIIAVGG